MMKRLLLKVFMLACVLGMSTNVAWGKTTVGEPADWYYVNFTTRVSTPTCGSNPGEVKLTYVDIDREIDNLQFCEPEPQIPAVDASYDWAWGTPYGEGKLDAESQDTYDADYATRDWGWSCDEECMTNANRVSSLAYKAGFDYVKSNPCLYLNTTNPTDWGSSASLNGYAMIHMADMDSLMGMTSYAYFEAKVRENDGWYFTGWSYTEGESDLGGHVDTNTEEDKGYLFKIFPSDQQGFANKSQAYAYATFKPVMVSNYKVNGLINGTGNSTTVVFDAVGERVSTADFTVSVPEANFSAVITSCVDKQVTVTVTYSGSSNGEFRGNVTLASKSGCSQLTAPIFARVGAVIGEQASLYNNKIAPENLVKSDNLTTLIGEAAANQIVVLNGNYESALEVNKNVTLNFNGYNVNNALSVSAGNVTIAYSKYGGGGNAITVNGGNLILNGGEFTSLTVTSGTVEQNGATFSGASSNSGTLTITEGAFNGGLTSTGTLIVNGGSFRGINAITINGGTANINRGTIDGTGLGLKVTDGIVNVQKLAAIKGVTKSVKQEGGTVNIECGKFIGGLQGELNFTSGYFVTEDDMVGLTTGKEIFQLTSGVEYNEGYRFFLGITETAQTNGVGVCMIGDVSYARLEDALAYANNNPSVEDIVIFMTNDYILPAGYYTLPANATIVVPMSDSQQKVNLTAPRLVYNDVNDADANKYSNNIPYEFRRLTFANGVNMDVFGKIELTCTQYSSNEAYTSQPVGAYGHLVMEEGSHMTLQSGSEIRAWGFMTGKGETDARRGATVREMFQMGDWKGAMTSVAITGMVAGTDLESIVKGVIGGESGDYSDKKIFPVSQYFIQNVESPVKYHPGALLSTSAAVSEGVMGMSVSMAATDIAVVGVSGEHTAIFLMDIAADAENTWVRKRYDPENDIQVYDINSGAHIGSMELDLGGVSLGGVSIPVRLNSAKFDLPITSNFKIHLLTGNMDFEQNTALLPGSEVEVDKESTVSISMNNEDKAAKEAGTENHVYHSGAVFVYDQADWDTYAYNNKYTKVVRYAPSALSGAGGRPNKRAEGTCPASAKINVHGTFNTMDGFVYTSAGGAEIVSSNEDAGSFVFNSPATDAGSREVYQIKGKGTKDSHYQSKPFTTAQLKNGNGSYTNTESAVLGGLTFVYRDGAWQEPMTPTATDVIVTYNSNCYTADVSMMGYVAQAYDVTDYSSQQAILASPLKENVLIYYAPDNIAEYLVAKKIAAEYASYTLNAAEYEYAKAHLNDDHSGDSPEDQAKFALFAQLFPTIAPAVADIKDADYDFGSAVQNLYIKPQEWVEIAGTAHLQLAIGDVSDFEDTYADSVSSGKYDGCPDIVGEYLAYMEANKMNLTIDGVDGNSDHTYSDAAGAGRLFILADEDACQWWEVEKKNNLYHCIHPDNDTYYYWDEDENAWLEQQFRISWKNWNGNIVQTADADGNLVDYYYVNYGTMAEFLGTNPTREETTDYTYDFTGWTPALGPVTSDVTYTATYEEKERKYTIIFLQEGGVEIERQFLTHNQMPVCENTPTRVGYTLEWTPAIKAVTGDATYTATWLEEPPTKYQITFYDYNGTTVLQQGDVNVGVVPTPPADPSGKLATSEYSYVFDHWSPALEEVSATSAKTYTAVYREVEQTYTIRFYQADGTTPIGEAQTLAYGAVPVAPTAGIIEPGVAGYTYTYVWENMADASKTIEAVKTNANYKPRFAEEKIKYSVTLKSNPSEACTFTGAGIYEHGDAVTISQSAKPNYTFQNWTDENGQVVNALPTTVTTDITLIANFSFEGTGYTITWNNWDGSQLASGSQKENTATTFVGATPTKAATTEKTYTFYGWTAASNSETYKNGLTPKATADETYTAYFNEEARKYNVLWKNADGTATIEQDLEQSYGSAIAYNSATPTKQATAAATYAFDGWSTTVGDNVVVLPATVTGDATFYAHFAATPKTYTITFVRDDGSLIDKQEVAYGTTPTHADPTKPATAEYEYSFTGWDRAFAEVTGLATYTASFSSTPIVAAENLEIGVGEIEELTVATTKENLIITSNGVTSGQLVGADNLNLTGDAYFDLTLNAEPKTWYAIAVPWQVTISNGISVNGVRQNVNSDFYLLKYNSEERAAHGPSSACWTFLSSGVMEPGTLYMIYMNDGAATIRFQKKEGASWLTTTLNVYAHASGTGAETDAGWNGIANPALYYAYLNAGAETYDHVNFGQKYIPGDDRYEAIDMKNNKLIVGQPVFVQVDADKSNVEAETGNGGFTAPIRKAKVDNSYYEVQISNGERYSDRLYIQTMENKEERYKIGYDLSKAGTSSKVAQMWVNRYDTKLCVNTTAPVGTSAMYPLGIQVPQDGEYQIYSVTEMQSGQELYVTMNGHAIWNLAFGPYTASLTKGTHNQYGLKLVQKAPAITTGVETISDERLEKNGVRKVLIDNTIYIIRDGAVYTINGQQVK